MAKRKSRFGDIFRKKYNKDPEGMTLQEIDAVVFGKGKVTVKKHETNIISNRGNVFANKSYDIDALFNAKLK